MGKASSSKKVARAARVGAGARRARASRSYFWPAFVTIVVVLGTLGVVFSRNQRTTSAAPVRAPSTDDSPPVVGDHWHAAYGVLICGKFASPVNDQYREPWFKPLAQQNIHNAYHTGQIILLRKLQGSWDRSKGVS